MNLRVRRSAGEAAAAACGLGGALLVWCATCRDVSSPTWFRVASAAFPAAAAIVGARRASTAVRTQRPRLEAWIAAGATPREALTCVRTSWFEGATLLLSALAALRGVSRSEPKLPEMNVDALHVATSLLAGWLACRFARQMTIAGLCPDLRLPDMAPAESKTPFRPDAPPDDGGARPKVFDSRPGARDDA